jgi:hypothetical protein
VIGIWQAVVLGAVIIAQHPVGRHMRSDPLRRDDRQRIERMAHGFDHEFEPIELANGAQHMRRVGPLPPTRFEQALGTQVPENFVEEELLVRSSDQTGAKLA